jgi:DNA processing protein
MTRNGPCVPAEDPPVDDPRPIGFPTGFGLGPREEDAILMLRCLLGITPRSLHDLIWREGSAVGALAAIVRGAAGSDGDRAFVTDATPAAIRERVTAAGARFAKPGDAEYWPAFLRLDDPPVGVFLRGRALSLEHRRVAIVGSRRPSSTGAEVAGGSTVAVLGSGIDRDYPATNRRLLREIRDRGTLVSEYPPGVPAEPFRFPARNRLIAALSIGVVIVEGVARSGTRSTAEFASQVGIDVFGVPGPITSSLSEAPNALIRDGAHLIRGVDDLLDDLGIEHASVPLTPDGLPDAERAALEALEEPMLPDAVARAIGRPVPEAISVLLHLELRGLVLGSGGRYRRAFGAASSTARHPP